MMKISGLRLEDRAKEIMEMGHSRGAKAIIELVTTLVTRENEACQQIVRCKWSTDTQLQEMQQRRQRFDRNLAV